MARQVTCGAEVEVANRTGPDQTSTSGTVTRDTALFRSGLASYKCDSTGSNVAAMVTPQGTVTVSTTAYFRAYFCFSALPASTISIFQVLFSTGFSARITSGGKIQLWNDSTAAQVGSDSAATIVADGTTWYRIELSTAIAATSHATAAELRLDGVSVASVTGLDQTVGSNWRLGWMAAPGASKIVNIDDCAFNDSTGSVNNSWCGEGKVILMMPSSDNQRGVWTAGAGGTSNLWDAVNNTPPVGVATGSATNTSQTKSSATGSQTTANEYRGDCGSYATAGIQGHDFINAMTIWVNHGEEVATGTKTLLFYAVSNPASSTSSVSFGHDAGAAGTYPTNWAWDSLLVDVPLVTKTTSLVLGTRRTDSGSRLGDVDFLGAYVDYTPVSSRNPAINHQDPAFV